MKTESPIVSGVASWAGIVLVWLLGIASILSLGAESLSLILGRQLWPGLAGAPLTACSLPNFCATTGPAETPVAVDAISQTTVILSAIPGLVLIVTIVVALVLGTRVVRGISRGDAFAVGQVRHLGLASGTLVVGGAASYVLYRLAFNSATDDVTAYMDARAVSQASITVGFGPGIPSLAILLGALGLVAWVAFRQGSRMREELDGVV